MESAGGGGGGGTLSGEHWRSLSCSESEDTRMQRGGADVVGGLSRSGGGGGGAAEVADAAEETWMGWAGAQGAIGFALMALFYIFASISVEAPDAETSRCSYTSRLRPHTLAA